MEWQGVKELMCHDKSELAGVMRDVGDCIVPAQAPSVGMRKWTELCILGGSHCKTSLHEVYLLDGRTSTMESREYLATPGGQLTNAKWSHGQHLLAICRA